MKPLKFIAVSLITLMPFIGMNTSFAKTGTQCYATVSDYNRKYECPNLEKTYVSVEEIYEMGYRVVAVVQFSDRNFRLFIEKD